MKMGKIRQIILTKRARNGRRRKPGQPSIRRRWLSRDIACLVWLCGVPTPGFPVPRSFSGFLMTTGPDRTVGGGMLLNGVIGRGVSSGGAVAGGKTSLLEHRVTLLVSFALLTYFLWMDVALYHRIQSLQLAGPTPAPAPSRLFSPFTGLSIKMMMLDQVNNYIHAPLANLFDRVTRFTEVFYFITPNMISVAGVVSALAAAKVVTAESLAMQRLAVLLMTLRTFLDAFDGQVARSRMGIVRLMSMRQTSGYMVDGVADTIGFTAFLVGCFLHLRRRVLSSKHYLPMVQVEAVDKSLPNGGSSFSVVQHPVKKVMVVALCFGAQMAISCFFWDRYINEYHILLETPGSRKEVAQTEVLRSSMMWIIMWFWRIANAHALMQMFLFAIFINRMWEFLLWIQYIGFAVLGTLVVFTEFHLRTVRSYLL
ncbi:ceramide phosphoethanolamine synthase isoform X1 [Dermacentor silvarum]|uniref:ceramide phosphoethanolamine synthase isoform X1 n=2 Tax=Dermacentor silvarum TaxID=543639 RepID=UPI002101AB57|nr:ceramide phosphoethanolamine synthase isoform X1 [Dermacentor silvarum]